MDTFSSVGTAAYNIFFITLYLIILGVLLMVLLIGLARWKRKRYAKTEQYKLTFLQVKLPKDNEIEISAAEHMFSNLMGFRKPFLKALFTGQYRISFEIVAKSDGIGFYVVVPDEISGLVEKQINAAYPPAEIDIVNPHEIWDRGDFTRVAELRLKSPPYYPIKNYEDLQNDSLNSITSAMSKLGANDVVAVQYVVQPAPDGWRMAGRKFMSGIRAKANNPEKQYNIDTSFLEGVEAKIGKPGFYTKIKIVSVAEDKYAAETHIQNMMSSFEQFADVNYNKLIRKSSLLHSNKRFVDEFIYRRCVVRDVRIPVLDIQFYLNTPILNTAELATVFHLPNQNVATPNITWLTARRSAAPNNIPEEGLYLGRSTFRGVDREVYIREEDRMRHLYIIGQTGTGKSVTLMELARQDIENGKGVAIIDPHGTDIEELLEKIPQERMDDVILFDAADTEMPVGINLLEARDEEEKHMIINSFIALLYKLYDPNRQGIMGPQLERAIRNVMLTAMTDPKSTMVDVLRLLIDQRYAQKFIDKVEDPLVKRFWTDEMAKTSDFHKSEKMGYFVSKFDRFLTEKTMRIILGQPKSAFNIEQVMSEQKILLIDLAKGKIGEENSNFLGLILVPRILSAAMSRHKLIGKEDFPPFYLYVDEFQNFATPDFATILSEARKYKLSLTVAHQFVAQLSDEIKNAIFGNVGTMCVYRVGTDDAEYLETYFAPTFTQQDIANLPIGNSYVRLLVKGHPTPPFSMYVPYEEKVKAVQRRPEVAAEIKKRSREKYGRPVEEVEKYINERSGFDEPEEKPEPQPMARKKIPF
jgi:DNA polymerase III delta prime subunit